MSFWDLFRRKEKRADTMIIDAGLQRILGATLDEDTALNIPAFSACVDFICGKIAELPIKLYRDNLDGKTEEVTDDIRVKLLNDETGDLLDPYQLKYAVVYDYLIRGTGFIYPEMSGNEFLRKH